MAPAFSSSRQAAAFALLVASLLAMPALVARTGWLDRRDVYPSIAWKYGPFPWIQQEVFTKAEDLDIVFLGSSHVWCAIDTPRVQSQLSEHLGRQAEVITLGWPWPGYDAQYVIARDLLDCRRVRMLVICDEGCDENLPHLHSSRWFRIGEHSDVLTDLSWLAQARLYAGAVLGMPRHLLSLLRPNLLEDPAHCRANFWNSYYRAPHVAARRGALTARLTYGVRPEFHEFTVRGDATPADVLVYSAESQDSFRFNGAPPQPYPLHFARKLAQLCEERGTRLVMLHTPDMRERDSSVISERLLWPEMLGAPVTIVGVPPAKLFSGLSPEDLHGLFHDDAHLNQNGQTFFTSLVIPTLVEQHAAACK